MDARNSNVFKLFLQMPPNTFELPPVPPLPPTSPPRTFLPHSMVLPRPVRSTTPANNPLSTLVDFDPDTDVSSGCSVTDSESEDLDPEPANREESHEEKRRRWIRRQELKIAEIKAETERRKSEIQANLAIARFYEECSEALKASTETEKARELAYLQSLKSQEAVEKAYQNISEAKQAMLDRHKAFNNACNQSENA